MPPILSYFAAEFLCTPIGAGSDGDGAPAVSGEGVDELAGVGSADEVAVGAVDEAIEAEGQDMVTPAEAALVETGGAE